MTRVLIFTATVGEGHDLPARTLADQLRSESPTSEIVTEDGLRAMGRGFVLVNQKAPGVVFFRFRWLWDATFWLCVGFAPTRRLTQAVVHAFGSRGVLRAIERVRPDVIVSVYPMTTEVLGKLRRSGRLDVPAVAAITDLAAMHYWAAPGIDLHIVIHPESIEEVREVAGADTEVRAVHGLTRPEFAEPCDPRDARDELGLPAEGKVVLVSGGGWGVGDLESAVDTALRLDIASVVCLCGRNDELRARLLARYADEERFSAVPFTEQMSEWLAACDALVHSTGGLTVLEAYVRGCPTISYGWGRGHIRANNAAFRRYGIAEVVETERELDRALRGALGTRPAPGLALATLPSAASLVLALVA
ncbi:MAG TPA: glycosyltransferase [Gaiellaceae bacterium]|nr:glycosyltransferase [Gaiellaceae bacterium]